MPTLHWNGKKPSEYAFIDTDDEEDTKEEYESSKEEPSTSKTAKKLLLSILIGMIDEYKTLLKNKGYGLPSDIFNESKKKMLMMQ